MKFTQRVPQKKEKKNSNSANSQKAHKSVNRKSEKNLFEHEYENEFWQKVNRDEELRRQHVAILLATPGFEHLSQQEALDQVDTMLRYITLLYEIVVLED